MHVCTFQEGAALISLAKQRNEASLNIHPIMFSVKPTSSVKVTAAANRQNVPFSEADRPPACGLNNVQDEAVAQQCVRTDQVRFRVLLWLQEVLDLSDR